MISFHQPERFFIRHQHRALVCDQSIRVYGWHWHSLASLTSVIYSRDLESDATTSMAVLPLYFVSHQRATCDRGLCGTPPSVSSFVHVVGNGHTGTCRWVVSTLGCWVGDAACCFAPKSCERTIWRWRKTQLFFLSGILGCCVAATAFLNCFVFFACHLLVGFFFGKRNFDCGCAFLKT